MPVSTIVSNGTLPVLTINGREVDPCGYMSYQAEKADYKGFVRAGYKLLYVPDEGREMPVQTKDYNRFRSVETANALIRLAAEAKRITGGQRIIGAFYGYAGTRFGHDAIDIVLGSKDVDFLASPFAYDTGRAPGTDWVLQGVLGSCRLHGKVWFTECDVRTHLSRPISEAMPRHRPLCGRRFLRPARTYTRSPMTSYMLTGRWWPSTRRRTGRRGSIFLEEPHSSMRLRTSALNPVSTLRTFT